MIKEATAAVIWKKNTLLIARRIKDDYWEFPGGRIDPGETPEECVIREIQEELCLNIRVKDKLGRVEGFFRGRDMVVHAFQAVCESGEMTLSVHTDARWILPDELVNYIFIDEDREIVPMIIPGT